MNIYDKKAWERLVATADAVSRATDSTYMDGRQADSTAAFSGGASSTSGQQLIFLAFEPPKNRWHILRAGGTSGSSA